MTDISDLSELKPRITVFGVGGAGGNAVNNMITAGLEGVEFVVANTDAQALTMSKAARTIQMGIRVTQGLGAGSRPEVGRAAAEEVIEEKGKAMMGRGEASGEKRVLIAAETAISNPLIEDPSIKRASGLLISITGGRDLTLFEVEEAATRIRKEADQDANIIVGATFDDNIEGIVRVSVVATGIDNTSVTRQPQAEEGALTNLAEKLRHDSRHLADRSQQDVRSMPITPSLLGPVQAEPSMTSTAAPERVRTLRIPRIDELTQNEIRAAQRTARDKSFPDKQGKTLMQRLASVSLGRTDAGNSIDQDSLDIPPYLGRRATTL